MINRAYRNIFLIGVVGLFSLACSMTVPNNPPSIGEKQTMKISEPVPADKEVTTAVIRMGAGKLNLNGGSDQLIEGSVVYNVPALAPTLTTGDHTLTISQVAELHASPGSDMINDWTLTLGKTPLDLSINAGAYEGKMDLGGVPLTRLTIRDGASKDVINFSKVNPEKMTLLSYFTGASDVQMLNLANANFDQMRFEGGAGNFKLDFSGTLQRNAHVEIIGGVNNIQISIPKGMPTKIDLSKSFSNIDTDGTWTIHHKVYETEGNGPMLTMDVQSGMANVQLIQK